MNKIYCSVVLMSRGRPKMLKECISRAYKLAKHKDNLEFIIRIDNDDLDTINLFKNDDYFKQIKNLQVYVDKRVGFGFLWLMFRDMFRLAKGTIIIPISDDLHIGRKDWDTHLYQYKDVKLVIGNFARIAITKKLLEEDEYISNWGYDSLRGDQYIYKYAIKKGLFKAKKKLYRKVHRTSKKEFNSRWRLEDVSILSNLTWEKLKI